LDEFQTEIVDLLPRLRRMARVLARHPADADDLVQVAVERALERRSQWAPGTRLDSWVFRIMKNAWIDETRSRTRKGRVFAPEEEGERVADDRVVSMETRLEAVAMERALAALPEEQRLPIALVLIEGLSYKEAAEVLEIPMGTVTSRLVRGRMALIAQFGAQPGERGA
jgi:RNA polymerase sigma factor (sigma-70 family)